MKMVIGKRKDTGNREVGLLIGEILSPNSIWSKRVFSCECSECATKVQITLSEEISSGGIWIEVPDKCSNCGRKLPVEELPGTRLTQEAIIGLFGK